MRRIIPLIAVALTLAACSTDPSTDGGTTTAVTEASTPITSDTTITSDSTPSDTRVDAGSSTTASTPTSGSTGGTGSTGTTVSLPDRPFDVFVPSAYRAGTPMPLLLLLHGYGATGAIQEAYVGMQALAEERGFLYVHPDGTKNVLGDQFWNATDACCQRLQENVDDVGYLTSIIDSVSRRYAVDPDRIWFAGHSNGGFMSHRMACERSGRIAAIVSLAGATWLDTSKCTPSEPVSVLQIHGTADATIEYDGGQLFFREYPSARQTVDTWVQKDGCSAMAPQATTLDLDGNLAGAESTVLSASGCPAGVSVDLWTIVGGGHIPALSATFTRQVVDWLYAHPKP